MHVLTRINAIGYTTSSLAKLSSTLVRFISENILCISITKKINSKYIQPSEETAANTTNSLLLVWMNLSHRVRKGYIKIIQKNAHWPLWT